MALALGAAGKLQDLVEVLPQSRAARCIALVLFTAVAGLAESPRNDAGVELVQIETARACLGSPAAARATAALAIPVAG